MLYYCVNILLLFSESCKFVFKETNVKLYHMSVLNRELYMESYACFSYLESFYPTFTIFTFFIKYLEDAFF